MLDSSKIIGGFEYQSWQLHGARLAIRKITENQRELMKRHALGPQTYIANHSSAPAVIGLIDRGLLRFEKRKSPRFTEPTTDGRLVIAALLADEADALAKDQAAAFDKAGVR